jgi:hypothetical protein
MSARRGDAMRTAAVDALHAALLEARGSPPRLRELLQQPIDEPVLMAVLRRAVPAPFLELLASTPPWSQRPRVLARVVLNPRAPRSLSLRLLPQLAWRELADVAGAVWVPAGVRLRAEALVREVVRDLRVGDKLTLARLATASVLPLLLLDGDSRVAEAALQNPRLREGDLLSVLRREDVPKTLLEACASSPRWSLNYAARLALVLQPRTPLGVALAQITSLVPRDLRRVAGASELRPLIRAAASGVLEKGGEDSPPNPRRLN